MNGKRKGAFLAAIVLALGQAGVVQGAAPESITLSDSYVKADCDEVSQLKDTKQVIVITRKDMEGKGYRTLSDVLNGQTSINTGAAGYGKIDIRGQGGDEADRNLVFMVDGVPLNNMSSHPWSLHYDVVPVENVEKIEIIPGGGSVLYGSGASGGVINVTTQKKAGNQKANSVFSEWNSDGYRAGVALSHPVNDQLSIQAGYTRLERDLQFDNTWRNTKYGYGGFRWDIDPTQHITFRASHLEEDGQNLSNVTNQNLKKYGRDYVPTPKRYIAGYEDGKYIWGTRSGYDKTDTALDTYQASYEKDMGRNWTLTTDIFADKGHFINNAYDDDQTTERKTRGMHVRADHTYGQDSHLLIGADWIKQEQNLDYVGSVRTGTMYHFNYDRKTAALYVLNTVKWGKYTFTQGLRREKTDWSFFDVGNNVSGDDTSHRWDSAGELSAAYHYNDTGRVYVRYERGYTGPDAIQVKDAIKVNGVRSYIPTSAEDETYDLYELGWRDKIGASIVGITLFESYTGNQMNRYYTGAGLYPAYTLNLLSTRRRGAEFSLRQRLGKLKLSESYTWLLGHSKWNSEGRDFLEKYPADSIDYTRAGLTKVPKHKIALHADYDFDDRWSMGLGWTFFGKYINYLSDADKADDGLMHSYGLVDISVNLKAGRQLTVYGGITNLFNKNYYEYGNGAGPYQTLLPGFERTCYVGVKYTF